MRVQHKDFLVEIGTEELPPKSLYKLAACFAENITQELNKAELSYSKVDFFATPRRIAVIVTKVAAQQQDRTIERLGPSLLHAYDQEGKLTPAALGFAKSCHVTSEALKIKTTAKGDCLYVSQTLPGEAFCQLAPGFIKSALSQLPILKPMAWGMHSSTFIRPVHWLLMLYGESIIPCQLFDLEADNKTYGHRFHCLHSLTVKSPADFQALLANEGYVISCYQERKKSIRQQIEVLAKPKGQAIVDEALLDEVTSLVEWPVALLGSFDSRFLRVPQEVLISAMTLHQKSFPLMDQEGNLCPYFIFVANIESQAPHEVVVGNERVMRARLADAEFFYQADLKTSLSQHLDQLKNIVFQDKLGTLYEKALRIAALASYIAKKIGANQQLASRAGLLAKADLTTEMVGEFPELQGVIGYYYALASSEPLEVALGIKEQYQPRFAGDSVPTTIISSSVALADKLDTLVGVFGISQLPTGEKDPFALRRSAVGVLRILIENNLALDLKELLQQAAKGYPALENPRLVEESLAFIMERLRSWYVEQRVAPDIFAAVYARYPSSPADFNQRIQAVQQFRKLPESAALASANKRVSNMLKQAVIPAHRNYDEALFELEAEKALADSIVSMTPKVQKLIASQAYAKALTHLAELRLPIDHFFDKVMVMTENEAVRNNRLILLSKLHQLFCEIADISFLQG